MINFYVPILTYADHVLANGVEVIDLFLFRSMDDNNGGAKDTEKTANLPVEVQLLIEQCGGENSTVGVYMCVCGGGGGGGDGRGMLVIRSSQ